MNMWLNRAQLAETLGCSAASANNIFRDIGKLIGTRYPRVVLAGTRVSYVAVIDFLTYKKELSDKNMSKLVPNFKPDEIKELIV